MAVETEKLGLNEYTHQGTSATTTNSVAVTPKAAPADASAPKVNGATNPKKPAAKVAATPAKVSSRVHMVLVLGSCEA